MAKKPVIDKEPRAEEDLGKEVMFAGADDFEHESDDAVDRGDDPENPLVAAVDDDDDDLEGADAPAADADDDEQDALAADAKDLGAEGGDKAALEDGAEDSATDAAEASAADDADDSEPGDEEISNYVSKDRFNAVNDRMKLAETNLREKEALAEKEAEAEAEAVPAFDYEAKERKYMELVTEGDFDDAMVVRNEIRAAEKAELQADTAAAQQNTQARFNEQIAFNTKVSELNEEYAAFNPKNEAYDQVMVDEVVDRRDLFVARGLSLDNALEKAAREVAKLFDLDSKFELMADQEIERLKKEEDGGKKPEAKKPNVAKKVKQAAAQPPVMEEGTAQEGEKSAMQMSDPEFEALPEAAKARMRGDIV